MKIVADFIVFTMFWFLMLPAIGFDYDRFLINYDVDDVSSDEATVCIESDTDFPKNIVKTKFNRCVYCRMRQTTCT